MAEANRMAAEAKQAAPDLPDWAGLAWIIDPRWSSYRAKKVSDAKGPEWMARAWRLCKALSIAAEWNADRKYAERMAI